MVIFHSDLKLPEYNPLRFSEYVTKLVGGLEHFFFSHILKIIIPVVEYVSEDFSTCKPPTGYMGHIPVLESEVLMLGLPIHGILPRTGPEFASRVDLFLKNGSSGQYRKQMNYCIYI